MTIDLPQQPDDDPRTQAVAAAYHAAVEVADEITGQVFDENESMVLPEYIKQEVEKRLGVYVTPDQIDRLKSGE